MANHAVLVQDSVISSNIDTLNRTVISTADLDNGNVFTLKAKSTNAGEGEVWVASQPATADGLKLSLHLVNSSSYVSIADGSIGTQRQPAYQFEVVDNSSNLWMAYSPEIPVFVVNGKQYKGLSSDPRDFVNIAGTTLDAFKPQVGDLITISADGISGTLGTNTYAVAANGSYELAFAASAN